MSASMYFKPKDIGKYLCSGSLLYNKLVDVFDSLYSLGESSIPQLIALRNFMDEDDENRKVIDKIIKAIKLHGEIELFLEYQEEPTRD